MRIDGDTVKFRNGRKEYANCGIIGIAPDGSLSGGYDDGFGGIEGYEDNPVLNRKERVELAEYMIIQWKKFAAKEIRT
jgi:hypothetical protein